MTNPSPSAAELERDIWKQKDEYKYALGKRIMQLQRSVAEEMSKPHCDRDTRRATEWIEEWEHLQKQFEAITMYCPYSTMKDYTPLNVQLEPFLAQQ